MKVKSNFNSVYHWLRQEILTIPDRMRRGEGEIIWEGRNSVRRFTVGGKRMVAKRFKVPMLHQRIDYSFIRRSKARRAFDYALEFKHVRVLTPEPVAWIEEWRCGLFHTGYFISLEQPGEELRKPLEAGTAPESMKDAVAKLVAELHGKGILHGDLNLTNMLGRQQADGRWVIAMVDLNRTRFSGHSLSIKERARNFARITHVRPLYIDLARRYAKAARRDADAFEQEAVKALDRLER